MSKSLAEKKMKLLFFFIVTILTAIAVAVIEFDSSPDKASVCNFGLANVSVEDKRFHCKEATPEKAEQLKDDLKMDQALLNIFGYRAKSDLILYANWDVCYECPCFNFTMILEGKNVSCVIDTSFPLSIKIVDHKKHKTICRNHHKLNEYGVYNMWISETVLNSTCHLEDSDVTSYNSNTPIFVALAILGALAILCCFLSALHKRGYLYKFAVCMPHERLINSDLGPPDDPQELVNSQEETLIPPPPPKPVSPKPRLQSLDTFRGISLVIMIFVNYGGGEYWFFHHSAWNGLTLADLVFPWFTFIMGTSIALAFKKMVTQGASKKALITKVIKRTIILFALGLMISNKGNKGFVHLHEVRIPGVLQRLAVTYLVVGMTEVFFAGRTVGLEPEHYAFHAWSLRDVLPFWPEWVVSLSCVALHLCLTFLLPVPGCPTGYLGPGGLSEYGTNYTECTGGAAAYIDKVVFGDNHTYKTPTCRVPYQTTVNYDPEGILGTLTSIFMCFLGLQAGKIIVMFTTHKQRVLRWVIWGLTCGLIAGTLCKFSQNDGWIPVNKNFWSLSFVLALSCMAYFLLIFCYLVIDVWKLWSGAPFLYPGMNSIVVYMCHEVLHSFFPIQFAVKETHSAQLALHLYGTSLFTILAAYMYYKNIFIAI